MSWLARLLVVATVGLLLGTVQASPASAATVDCTTGQVDFVVETEAELRAAIDCFNNSSAGAAEHTITFAADIATEDPEEAFEISSPAGTDLTINGAGFGLLPAFRGLEVMNNSGSTTLDSLSIVGTAFPLDHFDSGPLTISDSDLSTTLGFSQVNVRDSGPLQILDSVLGTLHALSMTEPTAVNNTLFEGAVLLSGPTSITNSSGLNHRTPQQPLGAIEVSHTGPGTLLVENSTFFEIAVRESSVPSVVRNSTLAIATAGEGEDASLVVESSIVLFCGAVTDGGNNVGCFDGSGHDLIEPLADNGCLVPTPRGCVPTAALLSDSPAIGAGDCTNVATDQRGEPRTPAGPGCEAGAFELASVPSDDCSTGQVDFVVETEAELRAALDCFNNSSAGAAEHTITFGADIAPEDPFQGFAISSPAGTDLTIDGADFDLRTVRGFETTDSAGSLTLESLSITTAARTITHLNSGPLTINDSDLANAESGQVRVENSGPLTISNSVIDTLWAVPMIEPTEISNSLFKNGIAVSGPATVRNSAGLQDDSIGDPSRPLGILVGVVHHGSGTLLVENSSFFNVDIGPTASGLVRNSTIASAFGDALSVQSSVVLSFCHNAIDGGNNVGCFDGSKHDLVEPLADNGCLVPTPRGCVPTAALPADSAAVGAGDCTNVATDQRGEPRTPAGPGCEAGAFELASTPTPPVVADGTIVTLQNAKTGRYLDADGRGNNFNVGTSLIARADDQWELRALDNGNWHLYNVRYGRFLDGDGTNADFNVNTSRIARADDEWTLVQLDNGTWTLQNAIHPGHLTETRPNAHLNTTTNTTSSWHIELAN